jgi:hypothetical protein
MVGHGVEQHITVKEFKDGFKKQIPWLHCKQ